MPNVNTGPILPDGAEVRFFDTHRPVLASGEYEIEVRHTLDVHAFSAARKLSFLVGGPRFALAPADIASSFPPANATGRFDNVLPQVILNRPTLPWERTALAPGSRVPDGDLPPWLALLVLTEEEAAHRTQVVAADSLIKQGKTARFAELAPEATDDPKQPVLVIDLARSTAEALLPTVRELELLTSVREVDGAGARAIVTANRICAPGVRYAAHLVSLEHQYVPVDGGAPAAVAAGGRQSFRHWSTGGTNRFVRLVSLANWTFHSEASAGDFMGLATALDPGPLALQTPSLTTADAATRAGAVPLRHRLKTGKEAASWYRGPLAIAPKDVALALPARHSDDLLRRESDTGLLDISYAAAWLLGRMLALRDPAVGIRLAQWKRRMVHTTHAERHRAANPDVAMPDAEPAPFPLGEWFETALHALVSVPFDYLVPDPELLPRESIRFFKLDPTWIAALVDGAFSIGRTSERERRHDAGLAGHLPAIEARSGILLRSALVDGWPDLMIDAFDAAGTALGPVRYERLGQGVLMVLVDGEVARIALHLHPQAIHSGFDGTSDNPSKGNVNVRERASGLGVVEICAADLSGLASDMRVSTTHTFAKNMIEGVPKIVFAVETANV